MTLFRFSNVASVSCETELVTVYAIEDPKTWIVHHQDVTGTLNYQREFESEDVAMSHAKSLKMHQ